MMRTNEITAVIAPRESASVDPILDRTKGILPPRLRLLCVAAREPSWINLTLQLDREGGIEPVLRWAGTAAEAMTLLRDEPFDAILIGVEQSLDWTDATALVHGIRSSGCADPVVILAPQVSDTVWLGLQDEECEVLPSVHLWNSPGLVAILKRALSRHQLVRESHRLAIDQSKRVARERDEAEQLLNQQRRIIDEFDARDAADPPANVTRLAMIDCFGSAAAEVASRLRAKLPAEIYGFYRELLRTYVIMASGNLSHEIARLADLLATADCGPREALALHLDSVESLVRGLGNRSSRHILARADLLALELMIQLGESYRGRTQPV